MKLLIGFGGNLGEPPGAFSQALAGLAERHRVLAVSQLYRTEPEGPRQPRYWNLVALLAATTSPLELLEQCQALEQAAGRRRTAGCRLAPRTLDLDLLIAESLVHRGPRLELPHPRFARRAFALVPAAELAADWWHPLVHRRLGDLAQACLLQDPTAVTPIGALPSSDPLTFPPESPRSSLVE